MCLCLCRGIRVTMPRSRRSGCQASPSSRCVAVASMTTSNAARRTTIRAPRARRQPQSRDRRRRQVRRQPQSKARHRQQARQQPQTRMRRTRQTRRRPQLRMRRRRQVRRQHQSVARRGQQVRLIRVRRVGQAKRTGHRSLPYVVYSSFLALVDAVVSKARDWGYPDDINACV